MTRSQRTTNEREAALQNQSGAIQRHMALVIEPATDEKQNEKEKAMNAQLKPVSIIGTIGQGTSKRLAQYTLIGAALAVLLAAAIAMSQTFTHRSPVAINHLGVTTQQRQFLETNTTSLPASVMPDVAPATTSFERMKFLEANINLGIVADAAAPVVTSNSAQRFVEVNTNLGMVESPAVAIFPYGEAVTPAHGPR